MYLNYWTCYPLTLRLKKGYSYCICDNKLVNCKYIEASEISKIARKKSIRKIRAYGPTPS